MEHQMRHHLLVIALFVVLCWATNRVWLPRGIVFSADVEAEKHFVAQVYYCENPTDRFSPDRFVSAPVPRGRSKLWMLVPAKTIARFRFDFGIEPGTVSVSRMRLSGRNPAALDADGFSSFNDVDESGVPEPGSLRIVSGKKDPFAVYGKTLDVREAFVPAGIPEKAPLIVLWLLAAFLAARVGASVVAGTAVRIRARLAGDGDRNGSGGRIPSFDFIRVLAFLMVVFTHVLVKGNAFSLPRQFGLDGTCWGKLGVSLFFILSGAALSIGSFRSGTGFWTFYRKRLRSVLPPFWVAYFVCLMAVFCSSGVMKLGGDPLVVPATVFGMDGYLGSQYSTGYLVGEWYLGCILLLYGLAPAVHRAVSKHPAAALAVFYAISVLSLRYTPAIGERLTLWNRTPSYNVFSHVFEFAFGMAFFEFVRPSFKRHLVAAAFSSAYLVWHLSVGGPHFDCSPAGILAAVALFVVMDLFFDVLHSSEEFRKTAGFLGKLSFLAFLYHHRIVHWVMDPGEPMGTRKLVYVMLSVVSSSFVLAFLSLKPAEAVARLVFGPRPPPPGSGPPAAGGRSAP